MDDKFTQSEISKLRAAMLGITGVTIDEDGFAYSTNGGFGHSHVSKENGKVMYYSHAPSNWDVDTGRVLSWHEHKVQYDSVEDYIAHRNGTILIDETR